MIALDPWMEYPIARGFIYELKSIPFGGFYNLGYVPPLHKPWERGAMWRRDEIAAKGRRSKEFRPKTKAQRQARKINRRRHV